MTTLQILTARINALQKRIESNMEAAEAGSIAARIDIITCEEMKMEISDAINQIAIKDCLVC